MSGTAAAAADCCGVSYLEDDKVWFYNVLMIVVGFGGFSISVLAYGHGWVEGSQLDGWIGWWSSYWFLLLYHNSCCR